jgi:hypothetical protein
MSFFEALCPPHKKENEFLFTIFYGDEIGSAIGQVTLLLTIIMRYPSPQINQVFHQPVSLFLFFLYSICCKHQLLWVLSCQYFQSHPKITITASVELDKLDK